VCQDWAQKDPQAGEDAPEAADDTPNPRHVFISGQKRGVFGTSRENCDTANAILSAVGHVLGLHDGVVKTCDLKPATAPKTDSSSTA
jgi:hypothetical protein